MKKILGLVALFTLVLAGCGGEKEAENSIELGVETGYLEFYESVAKDFTAETGVEVVIFEAPMFDVVDNLPTQKQNAPDVFMMPNDRIGGFVDQGLIAELDVDLSNLLEVSQNGATYQGKIYQLPLSVEALLLITNTDLVEQPETLKELGPENFAAKLTDFYMVFGLLGNKGGYVFGDGGTNPSDIGLNNQGAVEALEIISSYFESGVDHWALMQDDIVAYDIMMNTFEQGEVAAIINGPWAIKDIEKTDINYAVSPVPGYDKGETFMPFVGNKGLVVNGYSRNLEGSKAFVKFINNDNYAQLWIDTTGEVSPNKSVEYEPGSVGEAVSQSAAKGTPLPNIPEMSYVWEPMASALKQTAASKGSPKDVLDSAVNIISEKINGNAN